MSLNQEINQKFSKPIIKRLSKCMCECICIRNSLCHYAHMHTISLFLSCIPNSPLLYIVYHIPLFGTNS